jgi:hypothetical protein
MKAMFLQVCDMVFKEVIAIYNIVYLAAIKYTLPAIPIKKEV